VEWRLVDEIVPPSAWEAAIVSRGEALVARSDRSRTERGIALPPLERSFAGDTVLYGHVRVDLNRAGGRATITVRGPTETPADLDTIIAEGAAFWPLAVARELDDALLHLRFNEPRLGLVALRTEGDGSAVLGHDALLETHASHWLVREIRLYWKRVLKRLDLTSRSLIALIEPGSCFAGTLAELAFAADRAMMFSGPRSGSNTPAAHLCLSRLNFGAYPMSNGLTRLRTRFLGEPDCVVRAEERLDQPIDSDAAEALGLVTASLDEIDWDDEVRLMFEERASFSADALTAMEANLRFAGPETMETRIFGRLTAWQNWVFQRPSAVGERGALRRYGSGLKADYDPERV